MWGSVDAGTGFEFVLEQDRWKHVPRDKSRPTC